MAKISKHGNCLSIRIGAHIDVIPGFQMGGTSNVRLLDNGDIRVRPVGQVTPAELDSEATMPQNPVEPEVTEW